MQPLVAPRNDISVSIRCPIHSPDGTPTRDHVSRSVTLLSPSPIAPEDTAHIISTAASVTASASVPPRRCRLSSPSFSQKVACRFSRGSTFLSRAEGTTNSETPLVGGALRQYGLSWEGTVTGAASDTGSDCSGSDAASPTPLRHNRYDSAIRPVVNDSRKSSLPAAPPSTRSSPQLSSIEPEDTIPTPAEGASAAAVTAGTPAVSDAASPTGVVSLRASPLAQQEHQPQRFEGMAQRTTAAVSLFSGSHYSGHVDETLSSAQYESDVDVFTNHATRLFSGGSDSGGSSCAASTILGEDDHTPHQQQQRRQQLSAGPEVGGSPLWATPPQASLISPNGSAEEGAASTSRRKMTNDVCWEEPQQCTPVQKVIPSVVYRTPAVERSPFISAERSTERRPSLPSVHGWGGCSAGISAGDFFVEHARFGSLSTDSAERNQEEATAAFTGFPSPVKQCAVPTKPVRSAPITEATSPSSWSSSAPSMVGYGGDSHRGNDSGTPTRYHSERNGTCSLLECTSVTARPPPRTATTLLGCSAVSDVAAAACLSTPATAQQEVKSATSPTTAPTVCITLNRGSTQRKSTHPTSPNAAASYVRGLITVSVPLPSAAAAPAAASVKTLIPPATPKTEHKRETVLQSPPQQRAPTETFQTVLTASTAKPIKTVAKRAGGIAIIEKIVGVTTRVVPPVGLEDCRQIPNGEVSLFQGRESAAPVMPPPTQPSGHQRLASHRRVSRRDHGVRNDPRFTAAIDSWL